MFTWYRDYTSVLTKKHVTPRILTSIGLTLLGIFSLGPNLFELQKNHRGIFWATFLVAMYPIRWGTSLAFAFWIRRNDPKGLNRTKPDKLTKEQEAIRSRVRLGSRIFSALLLIVIGLQIFEFLDLFQTAGIVIGLGAFYAAWTHFEGQRRRPAKR